MRIVIKFAGALLEEAVTVRDLSQHVAALAAQGHEILIVHGGGRLFTATLKRLAAAISAAGQPAVGVSAADAACFSAAPLVHNDVEGSLGYVGYLTSVNVRFLESLWREKLLPVAPCLGLGADGELYNINADHMAAACAEFIAADHLVYLTDVAGVLDGEKVISALSSEAINRLIDSRVVSGGMILKLEAAKRALEGGVREVRIVGGQSAAAALAPHLFVPAAGRNTFSDVPGTRVLRDLSSAGHAAIAAV